MLPTAVAANNFNLRGFSSYDKMKLFSAVIQFRVTTQLCENIINFVIQFKVLNLCQQSLNKLNIVIDAVYRPFFNAKQLFSSSRCIGYRYLRFLDSSEFYAENDTLKLVIVILAKLLISEDIWIKVAKRNPFKEMCHPTNHKNQP